MELLTAIDTRTSAARLTQPGPTPEHLARILDAAGRAPDHGRLRPWQLIVLDGESKDKFAFAAAAAKRVRLPAMSDEQFAAEREKLVRSPTIVIVGCTVRRDQTKVPEIEQVVAAAAAAENLFLAAHGLGYGVMWKTGAAAYDEGVKATLGLAADDHIVAIMHLGTRVK
ncbi:MAG: nitroreductase family protein [Pseudomonadota bacterium]|nr:nitroreductase family protein [Pseudomonadota bacterium]